MRAPKDASGGNGGAGIARFRTRMSNALIIDGAHGEGGGQIVRSALALAAITGRAVGIDNIRAHRRNPGLAAQHLTAARAIAEICGGELAGDALGATSLSFRPSGPPRAGSYLFDVAASREGGSAGSAALVLQTVLLPLAHAEGESRLTLRGGTHMPWSPSFDYARDVWLPALATMGVEATAELAAWGWFPVGEGEIRARVAGNAAGRGLRALTARTPDGLRLVRGRAVAANLMSHIPLRMANRARALLAAEGIVAEIEAQRVRARCAGAGLFLYAEHAAGRAGFSALGERGKPSETVAEEAVARLLTWRASGAALDEHMADQLVLPAALASGVSRWTAEGAGSHLRTVAWLVELFSLADVTIEEDATGMARITVSPRS